MLISTKGRYALRVMIDLAEHQADGFIPLKVIAQRQEISEKYLENIIKLLVKAKLLTGVRGKGRRLSAGKGARAVHGGEHPARHGGFYRSCFLLDPNADACPHSAECRTLPMWRGLDKLITEYFENITLADLTHSDPGGYDYVI